MSYAKIEAFLWNVEYCLMRKYGSAPAEREMYPLKWYINTGRAPTIFLANLIEAKPFVIARLLHKGGTDEEVIRRIKTKLNLADLF